MAINSCLDWKGKGEWENMPILKGRDMGVCLYLKSFYHGPYVIWAVVPSFMEVSYLYLKSTDKNRHVRHCLQMLWSSKDMQTLRGRPWVYFKIIPCMLFLLQLAHARPVLMP